MHIITPVHKSGNKSAVITYHPISLLCIVSIKCRSVLFFNKIVAMARGHLIQSDGIVFSSGDLIQSLSSVDVYKYLGVLEADTVKH